MSKAHVHRFGDCIAASLGNGETVYLTPDQAKKFASSLNSCVRSVAREKFTDSSFGCFSLDVGTTGHNGRDFKYTRKDSTK